MVAVSDAEPQIVYPLGMMLLGTAVIAVPCYFAKQTQLLCYIIVGAMVGNLPTKDNSWQVQMNLSAETADALYDLGILFVLFMGGMEVDLQALKKAWKLVLVNGMGMIVLNLCAFMAICAAALGEGKPFGVLKDPDQSFVSIFFFGICCTLSSTILVLGALKKRGEMATMHGQIILGLMVLQDVAAVLSIAVMTSAFNPNAPCKLDPATPCKGIGEIIGWLIMWFVILLLFLVAVQKTVLEKVFSFFAKTRELLFIATFAYSLGVAALFGHFLPAWTGAGSFDQAIGIFFAGVSIAALPYRVQIETFVEPIRAFGVVLFFFMLGIRLPLDLISGEAVMMGVVIAMLTLCVFPMFIWFTGFLTGIDGKTAFMIGWIVNQVSEFSLIIGSIAYSQDLFNSNMYLAIVCGTLITFVFSAMGHLAADAIYDNFVSKIIGCLDARCTVKEEAKDDFKLKHHIVLLGFNEIGLEITEFFREHEGKDVLVIQENPELHNLFTTLYKYNKAKEDMGGEAGKGDEDSIATNVYSQYADPNNPDTWHHYNLHGASMVVSCQQGTTESDCVLAHDLANPGHGHHAVPFLCLSDSNAEARTMYSAGVRYVIQSESLAGRAIRRQMHSQILTKETFMKDYIELHQADMKEEDTIKNRKALAQFL